MKINLNLEKGTATYAVLAASAVIAFVTILGVTLVPEKKMSEAEVRIEPSELTTTIDGLLTLEVVVESSVPVNVFAGELHFDPNVLKIQSIDYNTSIADLWAEIPWYSNGDGTLIFGGGTTHPGGFQGVGTLIKVTFAAKTEGEGTISLYAPRILLHDGLGTDAGLLKSKDATFIVKRSRDDQAQVYPKDNTTYKVVKKAPTTDLNDDGKQTLADISIFMLYLTVDNERFDFNLDGKVDLKDLNVLLSH